MSRDDRQAKTDKSKTSILIVDDHPIVRQGLTELINHEDDLTVCGQAENALQAIQAIKTLKPDLVILDISLKGTNGLELIKDIKLQHPDLFVLVLSMHDESLYAERALRAGAKGYIMKAEAIEKVVIAIRKIMTGQLYFSENMATKMMARLAGNRTNAAASVVDCLSDRELEVFCLIGQGHGTRQISERLHLSIKTIETYRAHIKEKLNLADASELLQYAIKWVTSHDQA